MASSGQKIETANLQSLLTSPPLVALAIAAFGIGTSEFIIMGLLPNLSENFHVSIPRAGFLVTGYALSVTIGAPIVAIATARLERKLTLLLLMGIFTLGNLACALAPTYNLLFAARVLTALCHGAFFGIGSVVASNLVPRNQRAQAIALMFSGLTLANVLGVPAGTALGQAFGWRAAFWAIVPIGFIAATALFFFVPHSRPAAGNIVHEFRVLRRPQVLLVLAMSTLASTSLFCIYTYVAPMLLTVTESLPTSSRSPCSSSESASPSAISLGGKLSDWRPLAFLIGALITLIGSPSSLLYLAEPYVVPAIAMILIWGAVQFAAGAPLQSRIVDHASRSAQPRLHAQPGSLQPRQRHRRLRRRPDAHRRVLLPPAPARQRRRRRSHASLRLRLPHVSIAVASRRSHREETIDPLTATGKR